MRAYKIYGLCILSTVNVGKLYFSLTRDVLLLLLTFLKFQDKILNNLLVV